VRMRTWVLKHPNGVVVHASAVGDYMAPPSAPETHGKIESGQTELVLRLVPTSKIIDAIHSWSEHARIISFKAAAPGITGEALEAVARRQLIRTNSELVFANTIGDLDASIALVSANETVWFNDRNTGLEELTKRIISMATEGN
jgi:phosphopantothenoylcysteine synthetase/decarboxylase